MLEWLSDRAKRTIAGAGLAVLGFTTMMTSPYIRSDSLHLSVMVGLMGYTIVFIAGFVALLYGVGFVLLANNLWGH